MIELGFAAADHLARPLGGSLSWLPLRVRGRYTREEVLSAMGYVAMDCRKPNSHREGVLWWEEAQSAALFVTLQKSESDY